MRATGYLLGWELAIQEECATLFSIKLPSTFWAMFGIIVLDKSMPIRIYISDERYQGFLQHANEKGSINFSFKNTKWCDHGSWFLPKHALSLGVWAWDCISASVLFYSNKSVHAFPAVQWFRQCIWHLQRTSFLCLLQSLLFICFTNNLAVACLLGCPS